MKKCMRAPHVPTKQKNTTMAFMSVHSCMGPFFDLPAIVAATGDSAAWGSAPYGETPTAPPLRPLAAFSFNTGDGQGVPSRLDRAAISRLDRSLCDKREALRAEVQEHVSSPPSSF